MKKNELKPWCVFYLLLWYILMSLSPLFLRQKEEGKKVLWHMCANAKSPPKIHIRSSYN